MVLSGFTFWLAAATCNAVMDTVADTPHFNNSIFSNLGDWWGPKDKTWIRKWDAPNERRKIWWRINYPVQILDPWHFFKMLMIIFICLALVAFPTMEPICWFDKWWMNAGVYVLIYGTGWNLTFSVFYNKLFKSK